MKTLLALMLFCGFLFPQGVKTDSPTGNPHTALNTPKKTDSVSDPNVLFDPKRHELLHEFLHQLYLRDLERCDGEDTSPCVQRKVNVV